MTNDTRLFIKIRNHIFYYDRSYAMHNGGIVDMVVTYNADGSCIARFFRSRKFNRAVTFLNDKGIKIDMFYI